MRIPVFDAQGKRTENILEFDEKIFGEEVREVVLKEAILMYEARQRVGTHSTKGRGECSGSGRKLWRQKGTGRARVGAARAPHWKGGGKVFTPHPRDYSYSMPKSAKKVAINSAWLAKFMDKEVMVIEGFPLETAPKTKVVYNTLKAMNIIGSRILIGLNETSEILAKSLANIPRVSYEQIVRFNPYLLLHNHKIVLMKSAFEALVKERGGEVKTLSREQLYK